MSWMMLSLWVMGSLLSPLLFLLPAGSPPELLSFSQGRKGDLNSSEFPSLCFLWCGWRAFCARVLACREPWWLACCLQNKQGCSPWAPGKAWEQMWGEPCSPVLLCHAEWVRAEHHQAPLLPSFYESRSLPHAVVQLLCNSSCGSLALGLRWDPSENIKLYIVSLLVHTSGIAVADIETYISKNLFSTGLL